MSNTVTAILGGIAIALVLWMAATMIYLLFQEVMGVIAGFFVWVII